MALKEGMYVRCPVDTDQKNPRNFVLGKIEQIDPFSEKVHVAFYDLIGIRTYYETPEIRDFPANLLAHIKIRENAKIWYNKEYYHVKTSIFDRESKWFYYYLIDDESNVKYCCECDLIASYTEGYVAPISQLRNYEFQNPSWFTGRWTVSNSMQSISNAMYGFKELAGCKIDLKPYQLKTVMRCIQEKPCRMMIADEVGMGKTIEALCVLRVFMKEHHNMNIMILVPDALVPQWRTELAFKFRMIEDLDGNGNDLTVQSFSDFLKCEDTEYYDFAVIDEVHRTIADHRLYNRVLRFSRETENILLLSATPIQKRASEYQKLLALIHPEKYEHMEQSVLEERMASQAKIIQQTYYVMDELDTMEESIKDNDGEHCDETEEAFDDLIDELSQLQKIVRSDVIDDLLNQVDYNSSDFGIGKIQIALSYICEYYQLEKSIIRNRRRQLQDEQNERRLIDISYDLESQNNDYEYQTYISFSDWMEQQNYNEEIFEVLYKPLVIAFFSSGAAFYETLTAKKNILRVPAVLINKAKKWMAEEAKKTAEIVSLMEETEKSASRLVNILDFIDRNSRGKKVLLFTTYNATFELYKKVLSDYFGDDYCCWFHRNMESDELELNAYRFQNFEQYSIMLSDESGGEGRNFQVADFVVHIDLPMSANILEQRIGRLDRIGRGEDRPVYSVVVYAKNSLEESLFRIWNEGVGLFTKSQSGLEIIMNDIDRKIVEKISYNFKYGLDEACQEIAEEVQSVAKEVKKESIFDFSQYQYRESNLILERTIENYKNSETAMFSDAMLGWAALSGFNGERVGDHQIRFNEHAFSPKSASNTMFIPPNLAAVIDDQINQMHNRMRILNAELTRSVNTRYIQGTFSRAESVENDYIHFFAPGDEIFDSITENAIMSYKGTCAAFMSMANFNWTGLIFTWKAEPAYAEVMAAGIQLHLIDQYRGYLPQEQFITPVTWDENDARHSATEVTKEFKRLVQATLNDRHKYTHLGKRSGSNLKLFKEQYPSGQWHELVAQCQKKAKEDANKNMQSRLKSQLVLMQAEMQRAASAEKASALYFGVNCDEAQIDERNHIILQAFRNTSLVLDSVCYVRMMNND